MSENRVNPDSVINVFFEICNILLTFLHRDKTEREKNPLKSSGKCDIIGILL